jgi:hypothetical protein
MNEALSRRVRSARFTSAAALLVALALTACDSAGTVLDDTARLAAVEQCQQIAEGAGIASGAVQSVCSCAADSWLAKPVAERVDISPAAIRAIVDQCAGTGGPAPATPASSESY